MDFLFKERIAISNAVSGRGYLETIINPNELKANTRLKLVISIDYSHCPQHAFHLQTKQIGLFTSVVITNYMTIASIFVCFTAAVNVLIAVVLRAHTIRQTQAVRLL
jgi:hypothetical protein